MADVDANLYQWSTTESSNKPTGATTIATGLDDNLRTIQSTVRAALAHKGADIASVAGTMDIGAVAGLMHDITGALAITGLGTVSAGIWKILKFEGAATLTHNATSLILPGGANITCADGDVGIFISEGSGNWRCLSYMKANGSHLGPILGTPQASTSGTSIDFTSIPSWVKKITISFSGVSTSGTDAIWVQLGDSGGFENTGYLGACATFGAAAASTVNETAAFELISTTAAGVILHGSIVLTLVSSSAFTWAALGSMSRSDTTASHLTSGSKALSAALTQVRVTTASGSDTFDAGIINVLYE